MSKIHSVIPLIMGEVGAIEKSRRNQQQNYSFRGIDDAYSAFQPLFAKYGVFVMPTVLTTTREERQTKNGGALIYTMITVKHSFYADDGSCLECVTIGEAMDSGDKSSNKAMSAAMKYALLEVFCVPTEADNDTENHSPEPTPKTATPKSTPPPVALAKPVEQPKAAPVEPPVVADPLETSRVIDGKVVREVKTPEGKQSRVTLFGDETVYILGKGETAPKAGETITADCTLKETSSGVAYYELSNCIPF